MKKKQPYEKFSGVTTNTAIYYHGVYKPDPSRKKSGVKGVMMDKITFSPMGLLLWGLGIGLYGMVLGFFLGWTW